MLDVIKTLVELQENYDVIKQYNKVLKDGSQVYLLKKMKNEFDETKKKYMNKCNSLDEIKNNLILISSKINVEKKKLQDKEALMQTLKFSDHKIFEELHHQMESIKAEVKKLEDESLIIMEKEESEEIEKEKLRVELSNIKTNFYTQKQEVNNNIVIAQQNIDSSKKEIALKSAHVPENILKKFNDLINRKETAITKLEGGMCLACRMKVSSLTVDSIHKKNELTCCDNCERILYKD